MDKPDIIENLCRDLNFGDFYAEEVRRVWQTRKDGDAIMIDIYGKVAPRIIPLTDSPLIDTSAHTNDPT